MEFALLIPWLLALAALTVLGAPIAALVFRALPRRGAAFALPTALVPFAVAVFWIGQVTFGLHTVVLGVAVLVAGAALATHLGARPHWRAVARTFGVFVVGFAIMVVFRSAAPAITPAGGEQFLHFGLVNALERASALPPHDFWYAGEPLKYYYGTQLQVTSLSMLSGTAIRYGFNLGIATFYGVLFVVAYGLVGAVVHSMGYSRRFGGTMGAVFVALAGPTTTPIRFIAPHLPEPLRGPISEAAFGFAADRFHGGDLQTAVADLSQPMDWTWWYTRYVVPGTIQEVPLYSFVKGELHGHTLSTGYVLFAGALAYAYYRTPAEAKRRRAAIVFGGLGAVGGVFGFMNTWAMPAAGGLAVLAVAAADPHPATLLPEALAERLRPFGDEPTASAGRVLDELWRLVLAGVAGALVLVVAVAVASPFLIFGQVPTNDGIGFFPPRSPLGPFLVIYGGILSILATYVALRSWPALADYDRRWLAVGGIGLLAAVVVTIVLVDFAVLAITGPILLGAWLLVRSGRDDFLLVLLVAGVGLWLSYEILHARIPAIDHPRWNTAMKVSVQGWTLAAAAAGGVVATVLSRGRERIGSTGSDDGDGGGLRSLPDGLGRTVARVVVIVALVTSLVFPVMVVGLELGSDVAQGNYEPTLDGRDDLETWRPAQAAAIDWLADREGTPTIVEPPGPSYRFTSPASVFTGLPTVIGWDHQAEYRTPEDYERRVEHVDEIYTADWATAADHLERYDVRYVYVGPNARDRYGDDLRSFEQPGLSEAFANEEVTIYAVDQSALSDGG